MQNWHTDPLTETDLAALTAWRRDLHRHPEISRHEAQTAQRVQQMLAETLPDQVITGLGGHGVAAIWDSGEPGPTVLFRAETDALPIQEAEGRPWQSTVPGWAHLCGHDGHSAILLGLARVVGRSGLPRGRVVLLFQPAEEDGSGAAAVIADPRFATIRPDWAFAIHNMPGLPLGHGYVSEGPANCASRGMRVELHGTTAHAAMPDTGRSPMQAVAGLMPGLQALGTGGALRPGFALVTITHCRMGEPVYGIAPGHAEIRATLRTLGDAGMADLIARAESLVAQAAADSGLGYDIDYDDVFTACTNDAGAVELLRRGMDRAGVPHAPAPEPMRASEDFGRFGAYARSAMVLLGSGEALPALHTPGYDFPDALIAEGVALFAATLEEVMASPM